MPKPVHELVDTLLDNPDFYPEKSKEDRKSTAWAIAYSNYNKNKKRKKKKGESLFSLIPVDSHSHTVINTRMNIAGTIQPFFKIQYTIHEFIVRITAFDKFTVAIYSFFRFAKN
jgi:hypothetical protein